MKSEVNRARHRCTTGTILAPILGLLVLPTVIFLVGCQQNGSPDRGTSASTAASGAVPAGETARLINYTGQTGIALDPASAALAGITTVTIKPQSLHQTVQPSGQIAATDNGAAQVTSRLPGRIVQVFTSVGSRVTAGQLLATVDSTDLTQAEATYQSAVSHLSLMTNQLAQQRRLAGYGALSEQPIEDARRAYS
ncbi:MAG: efflux RND transporter periplasmic adaptor subunit, partial [Chloroflexi bacterium]|nr:efflux RND transporter periplasmic adaptor subunit [Chloroflexota bacterium]